MENIFKLVGGYKTIIKHGHPNATTRGRILEHRWVMSEFLGRPLLKYEDVHHINGNKKDNRIENLQLITHSEHQSHHNPKKYRTNAFCNICKSKTTRKILKKGQCYDLWYNDIDGSICENCNRMIKYYKNILFKYKSYQICNLCNTNKTAQWHNDIDGFLCYYCYRMIRRVRKKLGLSTKGY